MNDKFVITFEPKSDFDALVLALFLAITSKDDHKTKQCIDHAAKIAARLSPDLVEMAQCKASKAAKLI